MKKITLFVFVFLSLNQVFSQTLYDRLWGSGSNSTPWIRTSETNKSTNELYFANEYNVYGNIYVCNINNPSIKLFYQFPSPNYAVLIEQLKFDNNNNLIVYGRTHNSHYGTLGTYSSTPLPATIHTDYTFIAKINKEGKLVWFTYFHDLTQYRSSLTIDKNNNIYVLSNRHKNDILSLTAFQKTGDPLSTSNYQEVISKLDTNGNHLWSTFYFNDKSEINSIVAADDGIYVYGAYIGGNSSNNYFSTKNSYQEYPSNVALMNDKSTVFLSKFGFDGKRLWSTYFGNEITKIPVNSTSFPQSIISIDNDVYFLTSTRSPNGILSNIATPNSFISTPPNININTTLTKFSGTGNRNWTTYLYAGTALQKISSNDLLVTSNVHGNNTYLNSLTSFNAYQPSHGGNSDIYTSIISNDGKSMKYGSFYGYEGNDSGIAVSSNSGFYIYGNTSLNSIPNSLFSTIGESLTGNTISGYYGNFISYFAHKSLSNIKVDQSIAINIFPNPTTDILNIQSQESLPANTSLTIYDISGKRVLNQSVIHSNLNQINISNLNSGVYILQIDNSNTNQSFKFIKK